jgi:hypothetical protein
MIIKLTDKELKEILDKKDAKIKNIALKLSETLSKETLLLSILPDIVKGKSLQFQSNGRTYDSNHPDFNQSLAILVLEINNEKDFYTKQFENDIESIIQS